MIAKPRTNFPPDCRLIPVPRRDAKTLTEVFNEHVDIEMQESASSESGRSSETD